MSDELYFKIGHLIETAPELKSQILASEEQQWLGRVRAVIEGSKDTSNIVGLRVAMNQMASTHPTFRAEARSKIIQCLFNILAIVEESVSPSSRGAFIPVGVPFDSLKYIRTISQGAGLQVWFVDPYADGTLLERFAVLADERISLRVLTDQDSHKPDLLPATTAWIAQYGDQRPLEVRCTKPKTIHDRLIIVDQKEAWVVGQSFKDLGKKAPTTISRLDTETGNLKIAAHQDIWDQSSQLK